MTTELSFLYGYTIFIMFFLLMILSGAPTFLTAEAQMELSQLNAPQDKPEWINRPCDLTNWWNFCPFWQFLGGMWGFLSWIYNGFNTLYVLMAFTSTIRWISLIVVTPYVISLAYIFLKLARGGG